MRNKSYSNVVDLKSNISPIDFYRLEQNTAFQSHSGKVWKIAGLCPFHADKREGSFYINTETGAYKCHSCGVGGGDVIDFTMRKYELSFSDALQAIVREWRSV